MTNLSFHENLREFSVDVGGVNRSMRWTHQNGVYVMHEDGTLPLIGFDPNRGVDGSGFHMHALSSDDGLVSIPTNVAIWTEHQKRSPVGLQPIYVENSEALSTTMERLERLYFVVDGRQFRNKAVKRFLWWIDIWLPKEPGESVLKVRDYVSGAIGTLSIRPAGGHFSKASCSMLCEYEGGLQKEAEWEGSKAVPLDLTIAEGILKDGPPEGEEPSA